MIYYETRNLATPTQQMPFESSVVIPQLGNDFSRITLVNKDLTEQLTIDFYIQFHNWTTQLNGSADELVIIELETDGNIDSPMLRILTDKQIRPVSIRKYCLGTVLTNPNAKHNQFKRKLVYINKLTNACL